MICDFVSSYIDTWCKNLNEAGNYNFNYISPTRGGGGGGGGEWRGAWQKKNSCNTNVAHGVAPKNISTLA